MPSSWITTRTTKAGAKRYRVEYRLGGRESATRYGGSFKTKREADERRRWIAGELAARRVPDLRSRDQEQRAPTLLEAAKGWCDSRVDVVEQTANMHRSAFVRIFKVKPDLRDRRIDDLTRVDVADLIAGLAARGYKRETVRKTRTALAQTLDFYAVTPNPARDDRVKLPRERKTHLPPPLAEHVERVLGLVAPSYRLPLTILDVTGARVNELVSATVGDLDEERLAIRVRPEAEKNERYRYLHLPEGLFAAVLETLPPREDREGAVSLFPGLTMHGCAWRSRGPVGSAVSHISRRTPSGAGAGRSTTSAPAHSPRWLSSWATRSGLPLSTTSTR